jgi:pyrimidine operon attenuation protein/uracil phosphoribosyltransferase
MVRTLVDGILGREDSLDRTLLVGIRKRGVPLARRLAAEIRSRTGKEVPLGVLDITLYRDDLSLISPQPLVRDTEIGTDINGTRTILVDDVLYTGRTVRAALDALADFGRPHRIELAVLIDRGHRELPIHADHVGETVETDAEEMVEVRLQEVDGKDEVVIIRRE